MHLDALQLKELKEVLEDEFRVLVETYLQDAVLRLQLIRKAFEAGDSDGGRQAAHSLKGASANLGANQLSAMCEKIEHAAKGGGIAACGELIDQVEAEFAQVRIELLQLI
ncbi:MAG TPA: Hpt domain-containing protein [Fluviicoccus sp.]|nr:Hpt domain-containing protein [Fluviicoccus sp.]